MALKRTPLWGEVVSAILLLVAVLPLATAHGRMKVPPGRSTLWRSHELCHKNDTAKNYQDMQLNCGGRFTQWDTNKGKCGVCGDNAEGPQDNQPGGRFFMPIISRCYKAKKTGALKIDANIDITSNHRGYMEFKLCKLDNMHNNVTQQCLNKNVLKVKKKGTKSKKKNRIWIQQEWTSLDVVLFVPARIRCTDCVLQWTYYTGNNGKSCKISKRTGKFNCGSGLKGVETFVNCADIAIMKDCATLGRRVGTNKQCYKPTLDPTGAIVVSDAWKTESESTSVAPPDPKVPKDPSAIDPCSKANVKCVTKEFGDFIKGMKEWCQNNVYTDLDSCKVLIDHDRSGYHQQFCTCAFMTSR